MIHCVGLLHEGKAVGKLNTSAHWSSGIKTSCISDDWEIVTN
jgi:hypothetical protein